MAVPSLPAQGATSWFAWAQGLHNEVATGRLADSALQASFGTAVNVKDFGATGDGTTDDTVAIRAAFATGRGVRFPAGTYVWNGPGLNTGYPNFAVYGAGRAETTILLAPGSYLLDDITALQTAYVADLTFSGGSGAIRSRWTTTNVHGYKVFTRVNFTGYTGAAVSSNATDEPYWSFTDCVFEGGSVATSIGVALAGQADGSVIDRCAFINNRIDVKLSHPATARIKNSDFIPWSSGTGSVRARLWLVPDGSYGFVAEASKFGNENISAGDWHVLIAAEGSGTYVGDRLPDLATNGVGSLSGLTFRDCIWQGNDTAAPPLIRSHCHDLTSGIIDGSVIGTYPTELISYAGTLSPDRLRTGALSVGPIRFIDTETKPPAVSNFTFPGRVVDPAEVLRADPTLPMDGPGDPGDFLDLTPAGSWSGDSTFTNGIADRVSGTDASEITASAGGQVAYRYLSQDMVPGIPMFIEFDLKQGATPITSVQMNMAHDGAGPSYLRRIITPPTQYTRFRYMVPTTLSSRGGAAVHLLFRAMGAGSYRVGRVRIYQSRTPQTVDAAFVRATTGTTAPSAGGAGALPATPAGYVTVLINGTPRKIPYY